MKVISSMWMHLLPRSGAKRATNDHDYALSKTTGSWVSLPSSCQVNSNLKAHNADNVVGSAYTPAGGTKNISIWHCFRFQFACRRRRRRRRHLASSSCPKNKMERDRDGAWNGKTWLCFCRPLPWKTINIKIKFVRSTEGEQIRFANALSALTVIWTCNLNVSRDILPTRIGWTN